MCPVGGPVSSLSVRSVVSRQSLFKIYATESFRRYDNAIFVDENRFGDSDNLECPRDIAVETILDESMQPGHRPFPLSESRYQFRARVKRDAKYLEAASLEFSVRIVKRRHLGNAGNTPCCPEIYQIESAEKRLPRMAAAAVLYGCAMKIRRWESRANSAIRSKLGRRMLRVRG